MELPVKSPKPGGRRPRYRIETKSLSYNLPASAPALYRECYGAASSSTSRAILRNVSCEAPPGELLAIVGPSGAGKTTLLSILAGMIHPRRVSDEILVNGRQMDVSRFRSRGGAPRASAGGGAPEADARGGRGRCRRDMFGVREGGGR